MKESRTTTVTVRVRSLVIHVRWNTALSKRPKRVIKKEIAQLVWLNVQECTKRWKNPVRPQEVTFYCMALDDKVHNLGRFKL